MTRFIAEANISEALIIIVVCIIYISLYGYLRAYISFKLGDKSDQVKSRLTLNPSVHIDSVGLLFMLFYNVGFIKPMVNQTINFKNRKKSTIIIAILPTLILFLVSTFAMWLYFYIVDTMQMPNGAYILVYNEDILPTYTANTIIQFLRLSMGTLLFNLIPIYPLEGEKIWNYFVSPNLRFWGLKYDKTLQMVLVLFTVLGIIPSLVETMVIKYIIMFL